MVLNPYLKLKELCFTYQVPYHPALAYLCSIIMWCSSLTAFLFISDYYSFSNRACILILLCLCICFSFCLEYFSIQLIDFLLTLLLCEAFADPHSLSITQSISPLNPLLSHVHIILMISDIFCFQVCLVYQIVNLSRSEITFHAFLCPQKPAQYMRGL